MVSTAKLSSLGILFVTSVISGLVIPYILLRVLSRTCQSSNRFKTIIALMNCFSGGVFIATCLLTLLPEAQDKLVEAMMILNPNNHYPFTELLLGIGFLIILLIESVTYTWLQRPNGKDASKTKHDAHCNNKDKIHVQEKDHTCTEYCASYQNGHAKIIPVDKAMNVTVAENSCEQNDPVTAVTSTSVPTACLNDAVFGQGMSNLHSFVLLLALSIHMIFDGLSVGLQEHENEVWSLLMSMSIHKILIFLTTGITICESTTTVKFIIAMLYMSIVSPVGVGIGIAMTSQEKNVSLITFSAIVQAFAVGTFLYVAFFEILLKEFTVGDGDKIRILKTMFAMLGYALFAIIQFAMPQMDHGPKENMEHM